MKKRIVLYANPGTVLTNGTDYGTVIWLAEGADANAYHPITQQEYQAVLAQQKIEVSNQWN